jgi:hypothetical protein
MQDVEIELKPVDFAPPAPPLLLSAFVLLGVASSASLPRVGAATGILLLVDRFYSSFLARSRSRLVTVS